MNGSWHHGKILPARLLAVGYGRSPCSEARLSSLLEAKGIKRDLSSRETRSGYSATPAPWGPFCTPFGGLLILLSVVFFEAEKKLSTGACLS
jgi:hypothetical protein